VPIPLPQLGGRGAAEEGGTAPAPAGGAPAAPRPPRRGTGTTPPRTIERRE
jgi:hypothetical protein